MTDPREPMNDPLDDQIRDALRAEAWGVEADPRMLSRIQASGGDRPSNRGRGAWLLAAAAIAALVVGTAVVVADDGRDDVQIPAVDTTSSAPTTGPESTETTQTPETAAPAARPAEIVAVTPQGRLVVVDAGSGEVIRDLGGFDDPTDPSVANRAGGAFAITGVALHPNGIDVYFETCCEPASGAIYRVPIDGSVPVDIGTVEPVAYGYGIDISADGRWLAFVNPAGPVLRNLETGDELPGTAGTGGDLVQAAVNADGTELTVERALEGLGSETGVVRSELLTFRREADLLVDTKEVQGGDIRLLPVYAKAGTELTTVAARNGVVDLNVDAGGTWFLATPEGMPLRGYSEAGDEQQTPGTYLAADW